MSVTLFLVVNISCYAAEGGRKIPFSNYFNEVPNVSLSLILRENSDERCVEACLSAQGVVDGFRERRLQQKQPKQKEVYTKPSTGRKDHVSRKFLMADL